MEKKFLWESKQENFRGLAVPGIFLHTKLLSFPHKYNKFFTIEIEALVYIFQLILINR